MRRRLLACGLALALSLGRGPAGADPGAAEADVARGRTALKAKRWTEAEEAFRAALRQDPDRLGARLGLAEALLGAGQRGKALPLARQVAGAGARAGGAGAADAGEVDRARALLKREDPEGAKLERLVDDFTRALLKVGVQAGEADPLLARTAVERVRRLRPDHPELHGLASRLGLLPPGEPLWNGRDGAGWSWFEAPGWTVAEQAIVGSAADVYAATRTVLSIQGDYDVRLEARVLGGGKSAVLFLQAGWTTFRENVSLGLVGAHVLLMEGRQMGTTADPPRGTPRKTRAPVDPEAWNRFELQFRGATVVGYVNGERVGEIVRPPRYASGHVALTVLLGRVAFRRLELVRH
jgi:hypothetical protein